MLEAPLLEYADEMFPQETFSARDGDALILHRVFSFDSSVFSFTPTLTLPLAGGGNF
jgi:hypothetical protein